MPPPSKYESLKAHKKIIYDQNLRQLNNSMLAAGETDTDLIKGEINLKISEDFR